MLWPPDAKNQLIGIDPDTGKDWGREEKGTTENEMVGWHHRHDGHAGLVCCSPWGRNESDMTERLNCTNKTL